MVLGKKKIVETRVVRLESREHTILGPFLLEVERDGWKAVEVHLVEFPDHVQFEARMERKILESTSGVDEYIMRRALNRD